MTWEIETAELREVEWETLKWVDWYNNRRLLGCVQIDTFSSSDQTRFFCPFFPAIAHLKMSIINGGHLAGTPSRR
jgi:hypothetical protein